MSTKDEILAAMYDLVAEVGYDKASIGKISDRVGISKPSIYYYFPSKEEIFCAMLDSLFPTLDYATDYSRSSDLESFRTSLIDLGDTFIDNFRDDKKRRNVLAELNIQAGRIPALEQRRVDSYKRTLDIIEQVLLHGIEIGALSDSFDAAHYACVLYTLVEGMSQTVVQHEDIDEKAVWRTVVNLILDDAK